MLPDTNLVIPQADQGTLSQDFDGHRWQEFGVLPDRWKAIQFGGDGMATMLYVNLDDHHGSERVWTTAAELIGATAAAKAGAHNGWHAPTVAADPNDPANFVRVHKGQAGTIWDRFRMVGTDFPTAGFAGSIGSRLANRANEGFASGKESTIGPTPEMLRTYYRNIYITCGDSAAARRSPSAAASFVGPLGPLPNRSQNDLAILSDFLTQVAGTPQPRGLWIMGARFVDRETSSGLNYDAQHTAFLDDRLGVRLRDSSYAALSGNVAA